ncbi:MAG: peptidoglycan-associated lipoprotein [Halieaceae bacterium]|jgi:peptidoglycan-associated lipoprotein
MKSIQVAGKALTIIFAAVLMVACAGNDQPTQAEADAARRVAEEVRVKEEKRIEAVAEEEVRRAAQAAEAAEAAKLTSVFRFDFDQSTLNADVRDELDAQIEHLKKNTGSIVLEGHADERGTRDYNMALGERRAKAVADYMVVNGIASYRIESKSYGEERPVSYGSGESSWSQNRRVELK